VRDQTGRYARCTEVHPNAAPGFTPTFERPCKATGNALKYIRTKTTYDSHIPQMAHLCEVVVIGRELSGDYCFFYIDLLAFYAGQL